MIGFLAGTIHNKSLGSVTVLTNGVGYVVSMCPSTLTKISTQETVELYIYTHVREDILELYGFQTEEELRLFKLLLNVSGIGPKTALLVISQGVEAVKEAIIKANTDFFTTIPRLGTKNAQKIIIELKTKLGGIEDLDLNGDRQSSEITEALTSMGFSRQETLTALRNLPIELKTASTEQKLRHLLKNIRAGK